MGPCMNVNEANSPSIYGTLESGLKVSWEIICSTLIPDTTLYNNFFLGWSSSVHMSPFRDSELTVFKAVCLVIGQLWFLERCVCHHKNEDKTNLFIWQILIEHLYCIRQLFKTLGHSTIKKKKKKEHFVTCYSSHGKLIHAWYKLSRNKVAYGDWSKKSIMRIREH